MTLPSLHSPLPRFRNTWLLRIVRLLVSPGQPVKKGSVLLQFGTGAGAAMNYRQARQAVDFAMSETKRIGQLVAQQLATQSQLAAANKALADAETALHAQERIGAASSLVVCTTPSRWLGGEYTV